MGRGAERGLRVWDWWGAGTGRRGGMGRLEGVGREAGSGVEWTRINRKAEE